MADFVSGRAVIDAAQRKRGKYMTKCADIGYGFLPFSFSSFGKLEKDAVTLLKWVRKFFIAQDIGARVAVNIFNRISFSIAKGVGAQIVSRLPSNLFSPSSQSAGGLPKTKLVSHSCSLAGSTSAMEVSIPIAFVLPGREHECNENFKLGRPPALS
ncbi:hypothetical protein Tco_0135184 [Tanacetum coccineum]